MGHHLFLFLLSLALLMITITSAAGHAQAAAVTQQQETGVGSMMRSMVGSRPPSCAGRCWWCEGRHCEAVQVPITPQDLQEKRGHGHGSSGGASSHSSSLQPSSYDDHSNYKPLSWRCKCGGVL
ncbi:EPIDERMAL PATTERNING FACTOR-like protein 2 [Phragmites australis]|uniref:EPIDERMAL PATTERNING FACTOR-like protein 2 n=1 Tax=Phragmites australis TaxID=29695 RepID=UPI002D78EB5C|nr:EPIDERMAL PATTERNING FACTOR-like protein 2 [Phragmites australis]